MASSKAAIALLLSLNLLFFSMGANAQLLTVKGCEGYDVNVCVNVLPLGLGGLLLGSGGLYSGSQCCTLLAGLVNADAEVCLCAMVNANVLGLVDISLKLDINVVLNNYCKIPYKKTYTC